MNLKAWLSVWKSHAGWYLKVSTKHCPMCPQDMAYPTGMETVAPMFRHQQSDSFLVLLEMGLERIRLVGECKHQQTRNDLNVFFLPLDIPSPLKTHTPPPCHAISFNTKTTAATPMINFSVAWAEMLFFRQGISNF